MKGRPDGIEPMKPEPAQPRSHGGSPLQQAGPVELVRIAPSPALDLYETRGLLSRTPSFKIVQ